MNLANWWRAVDARIDATDPGALRRYHAARTALAAVTAWLSMRLIVAQFAGKPMPAAGLFAVTICFICALVVVDARRTERQLTLLLSVAIFALALLLASLLNAAGLWFSPIVLLALIFGSYAARRWGLRPGELMLLLTMGFYFAQNARVSWESIGWFTLAAAMGVVSLWLWQFVILPYNPVQALRACVRSFYDRAAGIVDPIGAGLEQAPADEAAWVKDLQRRVKHVRLSRARSKASSQARWRPTAGRRRRCVNSGWRSILPSRDSPNWLRAPPPGHSLPAPLPKSGPCSRVACVLCTLHCWTAARIACSGWPTRAPHSVNMCAARPAPQPPQSRTAPMAQRPRGLARHCASSTAAIRWRGRSARCGHWPPQTRPRPSWMAALPPVRPHRPLPPLLRVLGKLNLHPTTALGLQAVVATGLAMLVARLLAMDHANWVFWTAFVVIAGSTGDSLRKMTLRVVGTVGGATVGVMLALLTPDDTLWIVLMAILCIYLTIYFAPVSYPQMVFWLNIGFVLVYTRLGADELDLLFARPSTTLVGALVAALVVMFVFPIRTTDRFRAAAARFLAAVDGYVAAFVGVMTGGDGQSLDAAQAQVAATYAQVEQTLPGVAYENNPLLQAQSPITQQATQIAALEAEVSSLAQAAAEHGNVTEGAGSWMRAVQAQIHADIQTITPLLSGALPSGEKGQASKTTGAEPELAAQQAMRSWLSAQEALAGPPQPAGARQRQFQTSGEPALMRIRDIASQLAVEFGAAGDMKQLAGAN